MSGRRNILLLCYFPGAGGKFIANLLSSSFQVTIQDIRLGLNIIGSRDGVLLNEALIQTIPTEDNRRSWLYKEYGCSLLFGEDISRIRGNHRWSSESQLDTNCDSSVYLSAMIAHKYKKNKYHISKEIELFDDNIWLPVVAHDVIQYDNLLEFFKSHNVYTVYVDATSEFIDFAIRLKWPEEHHCLDTDQFQPFINEVKHRTFNYTLKDWDPRKPRNFNQVNNLARDMGVNVNFDIISNYINNYIAFHNIKHKGE